MKTLQSMDVGGKRVIVRADLNVSFREDGAISDDFRLKAFLPTLRTLQSRDAITLVFSHLGRPDGKRVERFALKPVAEKLSELLGKDILFIDETVGKKASAAAQNAKPGDIIVFENLRFNPGEESNDSSFARELSELGELYVDDAFGVCHRAHASVVGLPKLLPSAAGMLLVREIATLTALRDNPERPLTVILGGAKISTKLPIVKHMLPRTDALCLGGALANTVLKAKGFHVGRSMIEESMVEQMKELVQDGKKLHLPKDVVVAQEALANAVVRTCLTGEVHEQEMMLDIGPKTAEEFMEIAQKSRTVFWNGPLGWTEIPAFAKGTEYVARRLGDIEGFTVVGGGDIVAALANMRLLDKFKFISTGGGAMLEFLAGKELPGVAALTQ